MEYHVSCYHWYTSFRAESLAHLCVRHGAVKERHRWWYDTWYSLVGLYKYQPDYGNLVGERSRFVAIVPEVMRVAGSCRRALVAGCRVGRGSVSQLMSRKKRIRTDEVDVNKPPRRMVQMHLDFGQADVGEVRCRECGMVYSRGVVEDERVHKTYHEKISGIGSIDRTGGDCRMQGVAHTSYSLPKYAAFTPSFTVEDIALPPALRATRLAGIHERFLHYMNFSMTRFTVALNPEVRTIASFDGGDIFHVSSPTKKSSRLIRQLTSMEAQLDSDKLALSAFAEYYPPVQSVLLYVLQRSQHVVGLVMTEKITQACWVQSISVSIHSNHVKTI